MWTSNAWSAIPLVLARDDIKLRLESKLDDSQQRQVLQQLLDT